MECNEGRGGIGIARFDCVGKLLFGGDRKGIHERLPVREPAVDCGSGESCPLADLLHGSARVLNQYLLGRLQDCSHAAFSVGP